MKNQTYYVVIFGIAVFLLVFFPFYGINLRYQLSYTFRQIFETIGGISLTIGGLMVLVSILSLFTGGRSIRFHYLIVGVVLLWVGCWCTGAVVDLFGITIGNERASGGYH